MENTAPEKKQFIPLLDILKIENQMEYENAFMDFLKVRPLSYSLLKQFSKTPQHYIHYMTQPKQPPGLPLIMGIVIDQLILTPDTPSDRICFAPEKMPFLKDLEALHGKEKGREIYHKNKIEQAKWHEQNKDKIIITQEDYATCKAIAEAVKKNKAASDLMMEVVQTQIEERWTDRETGLPCIAKLDMRSDFSNEASVKSITDLKSAITANPADFTRAIMYFDYDIQAGMYLLSAHVKGVFPEYRFIVVEKTEPYGVSVIHADSEFIRLVKQKVLHLLKDFKKCMRLRQWDMSYDYRTAIGYHILSLPPWAKNSLETL